eukprot:UN3348
MCAALALLNLTVCEPHIEELMDKDSITPVLEVYDAHPSNVDLIVVLCGRLCMFRRWPVCCLPMVCIMLSAKARAPSIGSCLTGSYLRYSSGCLGNLCQLLRQARSAARPR